MDSTDIKKYIRELLSIFFLFCSLLLLLGLFSFDAQDPSVNHVHSGVEIHNKAGLFGAYAAGFLNDIFGMGALIWPLIFAVLGVAYLTSRLPLHWWRWAGFFLITICFLVCASAFDWHLGDLTGGGVIGNTLQVISMRYLSPIGSVLLWLFVLLAGLQLSANFSWINLGHKCVKTASDYIEERKQKTAGKESQALPGLDKPASKILAPMLNIASRLRNASAEIKKLIVTARTQSAESLPLPNIMPDQWQSASDDDPFAATQVLQPQERHETVIQPELPEALPAEPVKNVAPVQNTQARAPEKKLIDITPEVKKTAQPQATHSLTLPAADLLDAPVPLPPVRPEDLAAKGRALMGCFHDFDIEGELARITPGPVVTMFEVRPAPGIRVSKIANLSDDLSLALKAMAVRIQAPIPGSDTVGIEIPNDTRETVNFRELVESSDFAKGAGPLTMILGKTIAGHPFMADLTRMPHMLVAGATGAGKSVCLNSILISLLYRHAPASLKLLLVDPKRIEMAVYADLPHLVHPVVTEMEDAKNALAWAVEEMENRFKTFMRLGVRNIGAYHEKLATFNGNLPENLADLVPMPYMVIVIDELADLMLTAAREVEPKIQRLSQLARAAGIHMILATQRPSVDVVTGLIKAQFPCRISFQVSSKHDSRTILDQVGAEHLLGRGDMLFKPPGGRLLRLHGPFLSDEEVHAVVTHWKSQLAPDYQVDFSQWSSEEAPRGASASTRDATTDVLYDEAHSFVLEQGRASISLLQRHLNIGFNRAARLMEQFEREGIIGPANGSKPRSVIR